MGKRAMTRSFLGLKPWEAPLVISTAASVGGEEATASGGGAEDSRYFGALDDDDVDVLVP
jgi:hypothetical protein